MNHCILADRVPDWVTQTAQIGTDRETERGGQNRMDTRQTCIEEETAGQADQ